VKELRARRVLDDCRWALTQYTPELSGPALRVAWVGIVTLLRAVGHVLQKIDSKYHSDVDQVRKQLWEKWASTKPEPAIFWEFIENARNGVLKQYEFGFSRTFEVRCTEEGPVKIGLRGDLLARSEPEQLGQRELHNLQSGIIDPGPFLGRPEREVAAQAIEWWEQTLTEIELRAGIRGPSQQPEIIDELRFSGSPSDVEPS
jgi:hypothetical protein